MNMNDNTLDMGRLIWPLLLFLWSIFLGTIAYFFLTDRLLVFAMFIAMGSILPISVFYLDKIRNPRMIDIQEDGFLAVFRNGRSEFIPWERLQMVSYYQGDPTKFGMAKKSGGGYKLKGGGLYSLKDHLGKEMREAYARKMGKYPPMR